jgi:hypothetical protein
VVNHLRKFKQMSGDGRLRFELAGLPARMPVPAAIAPSCRRAAHIAALRYFAAEKRSDAGNSISLAMLKKVERADVRSQQVGFLLII